MIAFLHTLESNVDKFDKLAKKYASDQTVKHFVNENILSNALRTGQTDCAGFRSEIERIKLLNPELIICTCSSYGEACDRRADVERIDEPIVEYIVANYKKIGLAYAASSTLAVSSDLIRTTATIMDKEIEIYNIDCTDAWIHFQNKETETFGKKVAQKIKEEAGNVEVIFLAQASMEVAMKDLKEVNVKVLSSPEYGVKSYLTPLSHAAKHNKTLTNKSITSPQNILAI